MAYFISSYLKNSTTPDPSLKASAKHTSPASRMWSFKSCQDPDGGNPKINLIQYSSPSLHYNKFTSYKYSKLRPACRRSPGATASVSAASTTPETAVAASSGKFNPQSISVVVITVSSVYSVVSISVMSGMLVS